MRVLKFGGSSIGNPEIIKTVKNIILGQERPTVVVVSAFRGITDQLLRVCEQAAKKDDAYITEMEQIKTRHLNVINTIVPEAKKEVTISHVTGFLNELEDILRGIFLLNDITPKILDYILSFGERLSSYIISQSIEDALSVDARELIKTNSNFGNAAVNFQETDKNIQQYLNDVNKIIIVPGFIASDADNNTTTLGRGGSDYTAAIFAAALNSERLEIWTDVDGFMTADPRKVEKAFAIQKLSYAEAMELSHFGAKVVYTPTIQPVYKKNIEVAIKNTFNPESDGTIISNEGGNGTSSPIKGISSIDEINLVTLQGPGMVGVRGTSGRLFSALAEEGVNIILITQASSEYSITFAINPLDTIKAVAALEKRFETEIIHRKEISILVEKDLSIIAIVGEKMKNTPGISANLFTSLGRNGISAIATAQGSSELNISVVIKNDSLKKALNVIHEGFFLSHYKVLHLFIVGIGTVGSNLIEQIQKQHCELLAKQKLQIHVIGMSNSRKMLLMPDGIDLDNYLELLEAQGETKDLDKLTDHIVDLNLRNTVFIDCTASDEVSKYYHKILDSFVSVVTANKIACSSAYENYLDLKKTAVKRGVKFMFETNVGAGLPIINTINDLMRSGDKILEIEAVLSGTLNFIFNELNEKLPLSEAIKLAKEKGFSEPDPRVDLSGIDVIRKILILCREGGYQVEEKDVVVDKFLPEEVFEGSLDDFWEQVKQYDEPFEEKRKQLASESKKWRFVAHLKDGIPSVALKEVDQSHPSYSLEGSNNIILITTERYHEQPMIIRGYGAGADVTAAGVFADVMRVANV
jgi:aspartokinase/homoserine dehydrogenase 1